MLSRVMVVITSLLPQAAERRELCHLPRTFTADRSHQHGSSADRIQVIIADNVNVSRSTANGDLCSVRLWQSIATRLRWRRVQRIKWRNGTSRGWWCNEGVLLGRLHIADILRTLRRPGKVRPYPRSTVTQSGRSLLQHCHQPEPCPHRPDQQTPTELNSGA